MEAPRLFVVKKDGRREQFSREKLLGGLRKACEKRPISENQMELVAAALERELLALDPVAYIRFASVYRSFRDIESFREELAALLAK